MKTKYEMLKYTDKEWAELASMLSDEKTGQGELLSRFVSDDKSGVIKNWKKCKSLAMIRK